MVRPLAQVPLEQLARAVQRYIERFIFGDESRCGFVILPPLSGLGEGPYWLPVLLTEGQGALGISGEWVDRMLHELEVRS